MNFLLMADCFKIYTIFNSEISFKKNTILKYLLSVLEPDRGVCKKTSVRSVKKNKNSSL